MSGGIEEKGSPDLRAINKRGIGPTSYSSLLLLLTISISHSIRTGLLLSLLNVPRVTVVVHSLIKMVGWLMVFC